MDSNLSHSLSTALVVHVSIFINSRLSASPLLSCISKINQTIFTRNGKKLYTWKEYSEPLPLACFSGSLSRLLDFDLETRKNVYY